MLGLLRRGIQAEDGDCRDYISRVEGARPSDLSLCPTTHHHFITIHTQLAMLRFELPHGDPIQVPLDVFVKDFMPPLPLELDFDAFLRGLRIRRRNGKQLLTKDRRVWGYGHRTPSQLPPHRAFSHLKTCAEKLVAAFPHLSLRNRFTENGSFPPTAYNFDSLPHVYFQPCETGTTAESMWSHVAVSGIYSAEFTRRTVVGVSRVRSSMLSLALTLVC